jgi:uracil-DNA glycosylase
MEFKLETSWERELKDEFNKPYFEKLIEFIEHEYQIHPDSIFPKKNEIFAAFNACPFDKVKVVILGQDPYPTKSHAHGLSFSVQDDITPLPKSLQNIFKEIQSDLGIPTPENGNLTRWANQGVLLLNTTLTVQEGKPESHAHRGWEIFTDVVISKLNEQQKRKTKRNKSMIRITSSFTHLIRHRYQSTEAFLGASISAKRTITLNNMAKRKSFGNIYVFLVFRNIDRNRTAS